MIGACTRHTRRGRERRRRALTLAALAAAAGEIGDHLVRNRGTIGGSLAQADPHGDFPAVALAVGAEIVVQSASGTRTIAADDFFVDYFTTALDEGELITEIRIPGGQSQGAYAKFNRRTADWALMGAAVSKGAGGWRVALCGAGADGRARRRRRGGAGLGRIRGGCRRACRPTASAPRPTSAARPSTSATSPP